MKNFVSLKFPNPIRILVKAGYRKRFNGYMRNQGTSRFHAILGKGLGIEIHFDIIVKKRGRYVHTAFPMPSALGAEKERLEALSKEDVD